jgi:hypothetical protein
VLAGKGKGNPRFVVALALAPRDEPASQPSHRSRAACAGLASGSPARIWNETKPV